MIHKGLMKMDREMICSGLRQFTLILGFSFCLVVSAHAYISDPHTSELISRSELIAIGKVERVGLPYARLVLALK